MSSFSFLQLSDRDQAITKDVLRFRQLSSKQILRLHFQDISPKSRQPCMNRAMARLVKWGAVGRIPQAIGGTKGGSSGYFFTPPTSRARVPNPHTYDIAELYCRLVEWNNKTANSNPERDTGILAFDPEPMSHVSVGHVDLKPDAFLDIRTTNGRFRYFIEVDLSSEWKTQLAKKMRGYVLAYSKWQEGTFPLTLFVVPDDERYRLVEGVIKRTETPGLFAAVLMQDAIPYLIGE